jgi:hypothetical protein
MVVRGLLKWFWKNEHNFHALIAHRPGQSVTSCSEATADKRRKLPAEHEHFHSLTPIRLNAIFLCENSIFQPELKT